MLIEAVSPRVLWTAQRHGSSLGYVQLHYELGGVQRLAAAEPSFYVRVVDLEHEYESAL
jgi:hypothetical protein